MSERAGAAASAEEMAPALVRRLIALASHVGRSGDPVVRQELMGLYCNVEVARLTSLRARANLAAGHLPGLVPDARDGRRVRA